MRHSLYAAAWTRDSAPQMMDMLIAAG